MQTLQKKNFFLQLKDLTISSFCLCCRFVVVSLNNGHKVDFSSRGLFFLAEKRARESKQETGHCTRQGSTGIVRRAKGKEERQKIVEWDDRKHFSSSFLLETIRILGNHASSISSSFIHTGISCSSACHNFSTETGKLFMTHSLNKVHPLWWCCLPLNLHRF